MKLAFVFVGGAKEAWLQDLTEQYKKKIGYFCPTEVIRLKPSSGDRGSSEQKLADETAALLKVLKKDDLLIVCDERGEELTSKKWSEKLTKFFERGRSRVVIVIGGAFGFGEPIRARADWTWSFSRLTFNHHLAQAVVLEQTYRAFTIWKNLPYHND